MLAFTRFCYRIAWIKDYISYPRKDDMYQRIIIHRHGKYTRVLGIKYLKRVKVSYPIWYKEDMRMPEWAGGRNTQIYIPYLDKNILAATEILDIWKSITCRWWDVPFKHRQIRRWNHIIKRLSAVKRLATGQAPAPTKAPAQNFEVFVSLKEG